MPAASVWSVLDPERQWLGDLETPRGLEVLSIRRGMVLGVRIDEFAVEEVRAYRILGR